MVVDLANLRRTFGRYSREELARKLGDLVPAADWTNYAAISEAVSVVLGGKVDKSGRWVGRVLWYHPMKWQRIRHADGWFESSAREKTAEQKRLAELETDRADEREGGTIVLNTTQRRAAMSERIDAAGLLVLLERSAARPELSDESRARIARRRADRKL